MNQDIIVLMIVAVTIGIVVYNVIRSLTAPKKSGCGGCTGCDLSSRNKGCDKPTQPLAHQGKILYSYRK
jgi:hypothetical protein